MPKVTFIAFDGTRRAVSATAGRSLMRAAVDNDVPGIDADCGGQCACATCHVFVEPRWAALTGPRTAHEHDMLNFAADLRENSRLACQITVTDALDGLEVHLPEAQH
jgi:ferredoxin, 2Fe-2S